MSDVKTLHVPVLRATRENIAPYGIMIDTEVPEAGLSIPFYKGAVEEGFNLPFAYHEAAVVRTARIHPRAAEVTWLERHLRMTQVFVGLGDAPLALVLGQPNHEAGAQAPDLDALRVFVLPPGHGVMIHAGTWHDFPLAIDRPVTVLTMNSAEVVKALAAQPSPDEMNSGDVFKIDVARRLGVVPVVRWPDWARGAIPCA
jgi:ureidoglycolate lyase